MAGDGHPLRIGEARQKARIVAAPPVSGVRKRSTAVSCCSMPPAKRSSSEAGRPAMSSGGMKRALASCAKAPSVKVARHQTRQRREGSPIDPRQARQTRQPCRRCPVQHCRDQRHDRGEVDLAPEKAQRWRGVPLATAVHRTAEAEAPGIILAQPGGTAARLAAKRRRMECTAAVTATSRPGDGRKVAVEDEQLLVESGVSQHSLVPQVRPLN